MSVERVATNSQAQYLLARIMQANQSLSKTEQQVSSGKIADNYGGINDKTAALEAARAAAVRADAYATNTQLSLTQTDLQNTQLTSLSGLAQQLKDALTSAVGNVDGTSLMTTAESVFEQAAAILNATDSNGNYIYGGQKSDTKPFTATSLAELASAPVSDFFVNGDQKKTVQVGDSQTVQIGVLASDIGTDLMNALRTLYQQDSPSGSLDGQLTSDQVDGLTSGVIPLANQATTELNTITAANGKVYTTLQDAITQQQSLSTMYSGFVSDIEDVDMAQALTNLTQDQIALQAALIVAARLGQVSLLNYLPAL